MSAPRRMHLVAYLKTGPTANHPGAWRHPEAPLDDLFAPERYEHIARVLEAGRFDACFYADTFGIPDIHGGNFDAYLRLGGQISYIDPLAILPVMARVTRHLGLGATLSTTFFPPYYLARTLASLDLLTGGRAAWNVVTSATDLEARNFGLDGIPPKHLRYDRADEVLEACNALWDCWDEDAVIADRERGVFVDPAKVRYAEFEGKWVKTRGPLAMPRTPQVRPVFLQAGASERGREFAARWAEMVFCTPHSKADTIAFHDDIKSRMARHGRTLEACKVLPSFAVVVAETDAIAQERYEYLQSLIDPEAQLMLNSSLLGADLSRHRTPEAMAAAQGNQGITGSVDRVLQLMQQEGISFAEAATKPRGLLIGSPGTVADQLEDYFTSGACDGFIIWPTVFPRMFEEFCRLVVPELQRRGLFRTEYRGATLRDNLRNP
ncbi:NtaA/DmoA family FMN-dependent monooxygenase [Roseicella sp. DB1501]|uniref:NtaA/DmoA family FMN-dependent monooxygenase n=1 Tax=Roseicella sp. DB1501 TaxID=2730925 RepID=UPI001490F6BF|nr:NtaA/DmoA family FMN-dependent monooxygenase [Roseicella sp. DB1501]NOG69061.1 NtaA/DmoA family FMN-dependent monooxygenase [Roseicella sp. DB1501]